MVPSSQTSSRPKMLPALVGEGDEAPWHSSCGQPSFICWCGHCRTDHTHAHACTLRAAQPGHSLHGNTHPPRRCCYCSSGMAGNLYPCHGADHTQQLTVRVRLCDCCALGLHAVSCRSVRMNSLNWKWSNACRVRVHCSSIPSPVQHKFFWRWQLMLSPPKTVKTKFSASFLGSALDHSLVLEEMELKKYRVSIYMQHFYGI